MADKAAGGSRGPSPRDTLTSDPLWALDGDHENEVAGFGNAQKPRSRGESPLPPPAAAIPRAHDMDLWDASESAIVWLWC